MTASGQIGHRKTLNGEIKTLLYGNGCSRHEDCFTCPEVDCCYEGNATYKKDEK